MSDDAPLIGDDLIQYLAKKFPRQLHDPSDNLAWIMYYAGQRFVVEHLMFVQEEQNKNILKRR